MEPFEVRGVLAWNMFLLKGLTSRTSNGCGKRAAYARVAFKQPKQASLERSKRCVQNHNLERKCWKGCLAIRPGDGGGALQVGDLGAQHPGGPGTLRLAVLTS